MKVLYVTAHYPPDFVSGATLQVQRTAQAIAAAGHRVAVLSGSINGGLADGVTSDEPAAGTGGVDVHWIGTRDRIDQDLDENWLNDAAGAAARGLIDRWQPDVVHAHALQTIGVDALTHAAVNEIPTVVTMHDFWWWCPRLFLVDRQLQPCPLVTTTSGCACARSAEWRLSRAKRLAGALDVVDHVLVPSAAMRAVVIANGLEPSKVTVDENDVDERAIDAVASAPDGDVRFVYVGGDAELKGRAVLMQAAAGLRRVPGWTLDAYGVDRAHAPRPSWRHRRVHLHPPYPPAATAAVLGRGDVLVIPSIARESFSIAAREALGAGLAVITSDCLGPTEVVRHGINGLVVPVGDAEALMEAMRTLILDRAMLRRLHDRARTDPPPLRDAGEHAASLVARYEAMLATPRR